MPRRIPRSATFFQGLLLSVLAAPPALSAPGSTPDSAALEVGRGIGIEETTLVRLSLLWAWDAEPNSPARSGLRPYAELTVGMWSGDRHILDIAATPLLRWEAAAEGPLGAPYAEVGVGAHVISSVHLYDRCFSTALQFGEHIGLGTRFGKERRFDLSYRLQHVSNGGIETPNQGMLFNILRLGCSF